MAQPSHGRSPAGSAAGLLPAIVAASADAIIGTGPDGTITTWSPAAEDLYGYRAAEVAGQPAAVLSPPGEPAGLEQLAVAAVRQAARGQARQRRKDGTVFPAAVGVCPVHRADGSPAGLAAVVRDLSAGECAAADNARLAGDLARARESLQTFTISLSHDLVAPLRAMSGYSSALLEDHGDALGAEGRDYAQRIAGASERMTALINDLLHLSLLARADLHVQDVDLGSETAAVAGDLRRADPARPVRFVIERPVPARADPPLIRTALHHLLANAWKFTSPRAEAVIEFGAADGGWCFYVRDNGIGFDPAEAGKLFTPGGRLAGGQEFAGSGMGLASVRLIAERHGGRAWAAGTSGRGATFYFSLGGREPPDGSGDPAG